MAVKKVDVKKDQPNAQDATPVEPVAPQQTSSGWLDYIRFGESYTSLILGVVVVIITTILLVFTVRDRSALPVSNYSSTTQEVSSTRTGPSITNTDEIARILPTGTPIPTVPATTAVPTLKAVAELRPTARPTIVPTTRPTAQPTAIATPRPTRVVIVPTTAVVSPTPAVIVPTQPVMSGQRTHTVAKGDTLWSIAEKYYNSGYNWVDIATSNKLANPGMIETGTRLIIPSVAPKLATVKTAIPTTSSLTIFGPQISGSTYTVQKGDHLWGIAVRAYGDGYKYTQIAKANNIANPSMIYAGTVLTLPRTTAPPAN